MSQDEIEYAREIVSDCRSPLAYSIPATLFAMACFYVFGCLQQLHGGAPSIRTFIGGLPAIGATNITIQLLRVGRLESRLQKPITSLHAPSHARTTA